MPEHAIAAEVSRHGNDQPQPGSLLKLTAAIFIAGCLVMAGFGLSFVFIEPGACSLFALLPMCFLPVWVAHLEYRGTFRRELIAARLVKVAWLTSVTLLGLQLPLGTLFAFQRSQAPVQYLVGVTLLLVFFGGGNLLRRDWLMQLHFSKRVSAPTVAWRFTLREMLLLMAAVAVPLGVCSTCLRYWSAGYLVENVRPDQCPVRLPDGANAVSYYSDGRRRAFEFTVDEKGFSDWAMDLELLHLLRPTREAFEMRRYGSLHPILGRNRSVEITDGWFAENKVDGWETTIGYDKKTQRAYFYRP
jgi:hypothetical protein